MEPQRKQQQNQLQQNSSQLEKMSASSYLCRQNATRWTPTTEQIKLLKELYYVNGVRSPTADQIQAICARLRRYGKIEGKNVFYWFQNHKARERQKKRLTPTNTATPCSNDGGINCWKQDETTKYPCIINNPGISCSSSSAGVVSGGFGYGAVTMENKFRDCSISEGVLNGTGNSVNINSTQWNSISAANFTSYGYSNFYGKISTFDKEEHEQDHYYVPVPEKETLPLFPMHNEDHNNDQLNRGCQFPATGYYTGGYQWSNGGNNGASLELSLNSHGYGCYSHHY